MPDPLIHYYPTFTKDVEIYRVSVAVTSLGLCIFTIIVINEICSLITLIANAEYDSFAPYSTTCCQSSVLACKKKI